MDEILQFKLKFLKKTAENLVVNEVTSDLSLGVFADNQIFYYHYLGIFPKKFISKSKNSIFATDI